MPAPLDGAQGPKSLCLFLPHPRIVVQTRGSLVSQPQAGILLTKWWKAGQGGGRIITESQKTTPPQHPRFWYNLRALRLQVSPSLQRGETRIHLHIKGLKPEEKTEKLWRQRNNLLAGGTRSEYRNGAGQEQGKTGVCGREGEQT